MGRAARARTAAETRVKLSKEDFFELRAVLSDISLIELQAHKAAQEFKERLREALKRKDEKWSALTKALQIDPTANYQLDDKTCELIAVKTAKNGG